MRKQIFLSTATVRPIRSGKWQKRYIVKYHQIYARERRYHRGFIDDAIVLTNDHFLGKSLYTKIVESI
ncbi:MAG: hypothetical protein QF888_07465 [Desulfobacterales bacterium]|nr:hypothetical protein [Desulfobacterales bacterium]